MEYEIYRVYEYYRRLSAESSDALSALKGASLANEVFIIGSGPSIKYTDLTLINGSTVILLNNAIRLLDHFSPARSYLMISDHLRAVELREECRVRAIDCIATTDKVLNPTVSPLIFGAPYIFVMPKFVSRPDGALQVAASFGFSDEPAKGVYLGKSVAFPAIQMAWYMGATTISLVGIDMTIGGKVSYFDTAIRSNWSAFDYPRDGRPHFAVMRDCLRERGCILRNLTVGGVLDVLPHDPGTLAAASSPPKRGGCMA